MDTQDKSLSQYPELIDSDKLDQWLALDKNVLFEGEHGVGKTSAIIAAFMRKNYNYIYVSGATCDPYVDFVGIPRIIVENGVQKLKLITREDLEQADAIFIDEYNRAPKKVRNACMELIQFKAINGRPFPRLKCVWAAINPEDINDVYDVEPLDPAQKDRFHIHFSVPFRPCERFFVSKFGKHVGLSAIKWWVNLPKEIKSTVSPRRLDYALTHWKEKCDIHDILHEKTGVAKLLQLISSAPIEERLKEIYDTKNIDSAKNIMSDENNYAEGIPVIVREQGYKTFFLPYVPNELLTKMAAEKDAILEHMVFEATIPKYKNILTGLINSAKNKKNDIPRKIRKWYSEYHADQPDTKFRSVLFGEIQEKSEKFVSDKKQTSVTFKDSMTSIKADSNNFSWSTPYDKTRSWNSFLKIAPDASTLTEQEIIMALEFMDKLALSKQKSNNFFLIFEKSLFVLNGLLEALYIRFGYASDELLERYQVLKEEHEQLRYSDREHYHKSILAPKPKESNDPLLDEEYSDFFDDGDETPDYVYDSEDGRAKWIKQGVQSANSFIREPQ